jgi:hypothetical protein
MEMTKHIFRHSISKRELRMIDKNFSKYRTEKNNEADSQVKEIDPK